MKRARIILIVVALAVLGVLAFATLHSREPRYQSRTLSEWIAESRHVEHDVRFLATNSEWQAISHNVKQMARDAVPLLLKWVQVKDSPFRRKINYWLGKHPSLNFNMIKTAWDFNRDAMDGFRLLGDAGKPAWPTLVQLTKALDPNSRMYSLACLFESGPRKEILLPVLLRLIHDPDPDVQSQAVSMLHYRFPREAEAAGVYKTYPRLENEPTERSVTNQPQNK